MSAAPPVSRRGPDWRGISFVVLMAGLTGLFLYLGNWQLQRLGEKEALIATVAGRLDDPPVAMPGVGQWDEVDWEDFDYRPLSLAGRFEHAQSVLVFTSLSGGRGRYSGPGYWVMTPFRLADGGTVFVNRGFVPQQVSADYAPDRLAPDDPVTLTGVGRLSEKPSSFTLAIDMTARIDWIRDTERLQLLIEPTLAPVAPIYVDLPAGPPDALPQGGEMIVDFPNNHMGYAVTWFGFALITPVLLIFWVAAWRRPRMKP